MAMGMVVTSLEADYQKILNGALDTAFGDDKPIGLQTKVHEGYPAQVLLTLSAEPNVEMLVVGSRGHGGFMGLLIGSTSAYCAEHAPCPVVVCTIPSHQPNDGRRHASQDPGPTAHHAGTDAERLALVGAGLLTWGHHFVANEVHTQIAAQTTPTSRLRSPIGDTPLFRFTRTAVSPDRWLGYAWRGT